MFIETVEALSTGVSLLEISRGLFPTVKRFAKRLKEGKTAIAIVGAGGTGKTTLGKVFSGIELSPSYQESLDIEEYKIDSDFNASLIVVPGQKPREDRWDEVLQTLVNGKIKLVIHVVSWGYHSLSENFNYSQHSLYQRGMSLEEFIEVYQKNRLDRELQVLERKIKPYLSVAKQNKLAMITLVTKQDLWWKKRYEVKNHYKNGDYNRIIQELKNKKGQDNFSHEYLSASLIIENFTSGANELLIPNSEGYGQRLQFDNMNKLMKTIENLV
ncbi:MAG: hypothetical protein J7647_16355 [Cyanobacteria bacterium SBLK]|nr:hypothetical protein [Cyanobacteria bacterium SBLK]